MGKRLGRVRRNVDAGTVAGTLVFVGLVVGATPAAGQLGYVGIEPERGVRCESVQECGTAEDCGSEDQYSCQAISGLPLLPPSSSVCIPNEIRPTSGVCGCDISTTVCPSGYDCHPTADLPGDDVLMGVCVQSDEYCVDTGTNMFVLCHSVDSGGMLEYKQQWSNGDCDRDGTRNSEDGCHCQPCGTSGAPSCSPSRPGCPVNPDGGVTADGGASDAGMTYGTDAAAPGDAAIGEGKGVDASKHGDATDGAHFVITGGGGCRVSARGAFAPPALVAIPILVLWLRRRSKSG